MALFLKRLLLLLCLSSSSFAQETFLRRNLPMHSAKISHISTDAQGRYLLSGSNDKTAKLWDAHTGSLLKTYRVPIGQGNDGQLFAAALAPDARVVALGGYTGYDVENSHSIYLLNPQTGQILHRITGLPNAILDLEFSPDGRYLVAALKGNNGLRVYNTQNWQVQASLTEYGGRSDNIAFAPTGQLASVCDDGYIRLYDAQFHLQQEQKLGKQPYSLAFSPDGTKLAVGFEDSPNIQVLDAHSLALLYQPNVTGANTVGNHLETVAFSPNGNELWAGGYYRQYHEGYWWQQIRRWSLAGKGSYQDFDATESGISDLKPLPNGELWVAGTAPDLTRFAPDGKKLFYQKHDNLNFGDKDKTHLQVKATGQAVGFTPYEQTALSFSVAERRLSKQSLGGQSFVENKAGISLNNWSGYSPLLNGQKLNFLAQYEYSYCVDIAQTSFVLGTNWNLYAADAQGKMLWKTPTQAYTWAVNITDNQQAVVAAMDDGTIRWYRLSDGQLLLTLYVHATTQQWVLWTPSGYYDASAGAEDFLGWHLNQGQDQSPMFYPISKFRNTFYRPDVIDRILVTYDESQALAQANIANNRKVVSTDISQRLPPTVAIVRPMQNQAVTSTSITVQYSVTSVNNEPVTGITAYIDGRPIANEKGMKPLNSLTVNIPPRDCKVSIIAENRLGYSEPAVVTLRWKGTVESDIPKPKLYMLSVGISNYQNKTYQLDYAAKDAEDFANAVKKQTGMLYQVVEVKLLTNENASKDNILDGLQWLQTQTTSKDIAILFLGGHGMNDNTSNFYFLPYHADENALKKTGVSGADISSTVQAIAGKIWVFADACHSGNLFKQRSPSVDMLVNELTSAENGAVVFSSSTGRQKSLESSDWQNGAFAKALVEGFLGKAKNKQGYVTLKSLDAYIAARVKELTGGVQAPVTIYPKQGITDIPVASF